MGDYFFMFFIISNTIISIIKLTISSISNTPFIEVSEQSPPFLSYVNIIAWFLGLYKYKNAQIYLYNFVMFVYCFILVQAV